MRTSTEDLLRNIDWPMLMKQKTTLYALRETHSEDLEGIINLISELQDHVVDDLKMFPSFHVFGKEYDDEDAEQMKWELAENRGEQIVIMERIINATNRCEDADDMIKLRSRESELLNKIHSLKQ